MSTAVQVDAQQQLERCKAYLLYLTAERDLCDLYYRTSLRKKHHALLAANVTYLTATLTRIEADLLSEGEYGRAQLRLLGWGPSDAARKLTAHDAALSSLSLLTAMMEQSRLAQ